MFLENAYDIIEENEEYLVEDCFSYLLEESFFLSSLNEEFNQFEKESLVEQHYAIINEEDGKGIFGKIIEAIKKFLVEFFNRIKTFATKVKNKIFLSLLSDKKIDEAIKKVMGGKVDSEKKSFKGDIKKAVTGKVDTDKNIKKSIIDMTTFSPVWKEINSPLPVDKFKKEPKSFTEEDKKEFISSAEKIKTAYMKSSENIKYKSGSIEVFTKDANNIRSFLDELKRAKINISKDLEQLQQSTSNTQKEINNLEKQHKSATDENAKKDIQRELSGLKNYKDSLSITFGALMNIVSFIVNYGRKIINYVDQIYI